MTSTDKSLSPVQGTEWHQIQSWSDRLFTHRCVTIAQMGTSCLAGWYCSLKDSHQNKPINAQRPGRHLPPWESYPAWRTHPAQFQVDIPAAATKACDFFSDRILSAPSGMQPRLAGALGPAWPTSLKEVSHIQTWNLFGNLWLSGTQLPSHAEPPPCKSLLFNLYF